ncbi:hypothetical protein SPRG_21725, partial [Saprolegnia parasitica CBS 223.65]
MLKHKLKDRDVDAVAAILTRLQAKEANARETAALDLRAAVATLSRELTSETFARFLSELTPRLQSLLQSPSLGDQLGGIAAVEALIPILPTKTPAWDSIHGSLLVVMQLLQNTGSFMVPRFREVCDIVLCYKDSRDKLVARSVCLLLPQLAAYCPDAFVRHYLSTCVTHLMKRMTTYVSAAERGVAFLALGHLALSVGGTQLSFLPSIVELLQDGMKRNRYFCIETLMCVAHFTRACGAAFEPYLPSLVDQMMEGGLNDPLVEALADITKTVPLLLTGVQERLLNEISLVLRGSSSRLPCERSTNLRNSVGVTFAPSLDDKPMKARKAGRRDEASPAALSLSLKTLSWFNFHGPFSILPFVRDSVCLYLTHHDMTVRKQAVVACAKLLLPTAVPKRGPSGRVIDEVLQQLLQVGISDVDSNVRKSVVESLDARFDEWLSQETHLTLLFFLLNDETPSIREGTMCLLERLAPLNPAFILPLLRRVLVQLLTELEHAMDLRMLEDSTRLLGRLIRGSQHLIEPYLGRVLQVLLPKIQHGNAMQQNLASAVLTTIGELALAVHEPMAAYEPALLPLILDALQDHGSIQKRQVAL